MTKEEYIKQKDELNSQVVAIKKEAQAKINPIEADLMRLKNNYLQFLLDQNPHIKIGNQFKYGKDLVWIYDIYLDSYSIDIKVRLNKVKKDGTNGNATANSYGTAITSLKPIQG